MKIVNLRFEIRTPWNYFKNLGWIHGRIGQYKFWELEHTYYAGSIVDVNLAWSHREDHAGFDFVFGLLGYGVHFCIRDSRHWNDRTGTWNKL
jgi:hypothetical protein